MTDSEQLIIKRLDEINSQNSIEHDEIKNIFSKENTEQQACIDDHCKRIRIIEGEQKVDDSERKELYRKINQSIDASVALSQENRKSWKELSDELITLKIRDATFYGKVVLISGLIGIAATLLITKLSAAIWAFLIK